MTFPSWIVDHGYQFFPPRGELTKANTKYLVTHHSASGNSFTVAQCAQVAKSQGWNGDYHFVIYRNGEIHTDTRFPEIGTHALSLNQQSVGVCMIGNFTADMPTAAQVESHYKLQLWLESIGWNLTNIRHRDIKNITGVAKAATACPGDAFSAKWTLFQAGYVAFKGGINMAEKVFHGDKLGVTLRGEVVLPAAASVTPDAKTLIVCVPLTDPKVSGAIIKYDLTKPVLENI